MKHNLYTIFQYTILSAEDTSGEDHFAARYSDLFEDEITHKGEYKDTSAESGMILVKI